MKSRYSWHNDLNIMQVLAHCVSCRVATLFCVYKMTSFHGLNYFEKP